MDDFDKEVDFEAALITALQRYGWGQDVIKYPTEKELIQNWANILFENNRSIDRLGDFPLVQEEIDDLLELSLIHIWLPWALPRGRPTYPITTTSI